jgi:hypothetical protein
LQQAAAIVGRRWLEGAHEDSPWLGVGECCAPRSQPRIRQST